MIDTSTNTLVKEIPVGNAPRQVVLVGNEAFVSNEGGRPAAAGDFTNLSDGTPVVANPSTGGAITGTVSVVDLGSQTQTGSIPVGLQPTALFLHGTSLFVANSNNDSVSIVDTSSKQVAETIHVNPVPGAHVGSYPNAITMPDDHHLLVSIGRDNAIAVYNYQGLGERTRFEGLIPTDLYPVQVQPDAATSDSQILEGNAGGPLPVPIDKYQTYADIPSLNAIIDPSYPRFNLDVPDQYRVDIWERAFCEAEQTAGLANLNLLWLPDDHTSGVGSGDPYPTAQVADNDLALGRIVQDISHSRFWKSSAIVVLENDPRTESTTSTVTAACCG